MCAGRCAFAARIDDAQTSVAATVQDTFVEKSFYCFKVVSRWYDYFDNKEYGEQAVVLRHYARLFVCFALKNIEFAVSILLN